MMEPIFLEKKLIVPIKQGNWDQNQYFRALLCVCSIDFPEIVSDLMTNISEWVKVSALYLNGKFLLHPKWGKGSFLSPK